MKHFLILSLLLLLCIGDSQSQELIDHKIGKTKGFNVELIKHGDFYYQYGIFSGSVNVGFDQESVTLNATQANQTYVVKYDLDFNIVWARAIEATNNITSLEMYPNEDYLYFFWSRAVAQAIEYRCDRININDTSPSQYLGKFQVGAGKTDFTVDFAPDGSVGIVGEFRDFVNFPSISGNNEHIVTGAQDMYIAKFSTITSFESYFHRIRRGHGYPGLNNRDAITLKFDDQGNLHVLGRYENTAQLDGNDGPILKTLSGTSGFHVSFLPNGEQGIFEKTTFKPTDSILKIHKVNDKYFYLAYPKLYTSDLNFENFQSGDLPFEGFNKVQDYDINDESITILANISSFGNFEVLGNIIPGNDADYVVANIDHQRNLNWYTYFGADSESDYAYSINYDENENLVVAIFTTDTLDIDPSRNMFDVTHSPEKFHLATYDIICQGLNVQLNTYSNITCTDDANLNLGILGGQQPTQLVINSNPIDPNIDYGIDSPGVYEAVVTDASGCSKSLYIPVSGPTENGDLKLQSFAVEYRTGFDTKINLYLSNEDCVPKSGQIEVNLDNQIQYLGASIAPGEINGQVISFDYQDLVYDEEKLKITLDVNISDQAQFGTDLCSSIQLFDDQGTKIKSTVLCKEVINSYDPNDITVFPSGRCDENYFLETEELEYYIRFQNLGNAEAINIEVVDTLHADLDILSIEVLESSHDHISYVEEDSILIFKFSDIYLPAEIQDAEGSNGFISFRIKTKNSTLLNAQIPNKAAIYFDFNDPVITNEVSSTLIDVLPSCIISDVRDLETTWNIYPNPVRSMLYIQSDQTGKDFVEIYNLFGSKILSKQIDGDTTIDLAHLSMGMYLLKTSRGTFKIYKE